MHTVKPLDEDLLRDVLDRFAVVAVVEEHSRIGGLGSAVAEWVAAQASRTKAAAAVAWARRTCSCRKAGRRSISRSGSA